MSDGYTPREGTIAHKVIEALEQGAAGSMTAAFIANEFGCTATSVSTSLRPAVEAGLLVTIKEGRRTAWALPEDEAPNDGKLQIANWNDGDVTVKGGTDNDDGSVTYTRDQIQQLLQHVTTPHTYPASITGELALIAGEPAETQPIAPILERIERHLSDMRNAAQPIAS